MTDLIQAIRDRLVLSISTAATVVGAILYASYVCFMWLWSEFAHAADVTKEINRIKQQVLERLKVRGSLQ